MRVKFLTSQFEMAKGSSTGRDTIKRALTHGKIQEEFVVFRSNTEKNTKVTPSKQRGIMGDHTSSSYIDRPPSVSTPLGTRPHSTKGKLHSKTSLSPKISTGISKRDPLSLKKQPPRLIGYSYQNLIASKSQATKEPIQSVGLRSSMDPNKLKNIANKQLGRQGTSSKPTSVKPRPNTAVSEANKSVTKNPPDFSSIKNLKIQTAPFLTTFASTPLHYLRRNSRTITPSNKIFKENDLKGGGVSLHKYDKTRVPTRKRSLIKAFYRGDESKVTGADRKSSYSSFRSQSIVEERKSYGSKMSVMDTDVPRSLTGHRTAILGSLVPTEMIETQSLIQKLKLMAQSNSLKAQEPALSKDSPLLEKPVPQRILARPYPLPTNNAQEEQNPVHEKPSESDSVLEKLYRDLIKRTTMVYKEVYT